MARLKSRTQSPPNGFQYRQAETGWSTSAWDFNSIVTAVINHRRANARLSLNANPQQVAEDVDVQNAYRCLAMKGAEDFVMSEQVGVPELPKSTPLRRLVGAAAGFAESGSRLKAGVQLLYEWLGEGAQTVPADQAEKRAAVCVICPLNQAGDWTRHITGPVSEKIRTTLEMRREMKIETTLDDRLGVCSACLCPLKLKVHVPMQFILPHMQDEVFDALEENCWILGDAVQLMIANGAKELDAKE
jgi:hypothetical protein